MPKTGGALKILARVTENSEAIKAGIAQARIGLEVAQMTDEARTKAGLSQGALAALIGSKQPVTARLEDAGYEGHSLTMLQAYRRDSRSMPGAPLLSLEKSSAINQT